MLNKKEITAIIVASLIIGFAFSLIASTKLFIYAVLATVLVILVNITAKKVVGYYYEAEIETRIWEIKRYGFKPNRYFKHPLPAGVIMPLIATVLSVGFVVWTAALVFDVKAKVYRAAKRHGLYSFSEMTEWHMGLIAAAGIMANLIFAVIGYLINFEFAIIFAKISIYYAFFNLIPLSDLDGNKIFFGSIVLWSFLVALSVIAIGYAILLP